MKRTKNSTGSTYIKKVSKIIDQYILEHACDEWSMDAIAEWAVETGRYQRPSISTVKQCRRDLARAAQQVMYKDPQGREVRRLHAVRQNGEGGPSAIWADITTAKPRHMHLSLQQGRQAIVYDAHRHQMILESYNDNNRYGVQLPLFDYNLNPDIDEMKRPSDYPDSPPKKP